MDTEPSWHGGHQGCPGGHSRLQLQAGVLLLDDLCATKLCPQKWEESAPTPQRGRDCVRACVCMYMWGMGVGRDTHTQACIHACTHPERQNETLKNRD